MAVVLPSSNPLQSGFPRAPYSPPVVVNGTTYYCPEPSLYYYNNAAAPKGRAQINNKNNLYISNHPQYSYGKTQRAGPGPRRNASPKPRTPLRTTTNYPRKSPSFEKKPPVASYYPVNPAQSSPALVSVDIPAKPPVRVPSPPRVQARPISPPRSPPAYTPTPTSAPAAKQEMVYRVEHESKVASVTTPVTPVNPDVVQLNSSFLRDYCSRPALFNASNPQHAQWITIIAAALTQLDSPLARSIIQEQPLVILRFQQWNLVRCCSAAIEDSAKNAKDRCGEYLTACKGGADPAGGKRWLKEREVKRKSPSLRQAVIVNNHRKKGELLRAKMFDEAIPAEEYARAILELKL